MQRLSNKANGNQHHYNDKNISLSSPRLKQFIKIRDITKKKKKSNNADAPCPQKCEMRKQK